MYEDIQKTLDLSNSPKGAPNFLLALVLCCYTEYWGKLLLENPKESSRKAFEAFFKRLGQDYQTLVDNTDIDIYRDIRCGLAHAYLIEGRDAAINIGKGSNGVVYDPKLNKYTLYVSTYFEDFKNAVDVYINGLESGAENLSNLENALKAKPELI
jgi:hypothetical protein